MCFSLHITTEKVNGWKYSFGNFSIFYLIQIFVLIYFYICMIRVIFKSRLINRGQFKKRIHNIVKTSLIIVLTNMICFLPISLLGLI